MTVMEDLRYSHNVLLSFELYIFLPVCFFILSCFFIQVANYCRDRIHAALVEEIETAKTLFNDGNVYDCCKELWTKVFTNCFLKVDTEVGGKASLEPIAPETVGSTAVVAVICSSHIIVANCGDSRAVLYRGKEPIALSVDHKVRSL